MEASDGAQNYRRNAPPPMMVPPAPQFDHQSVPSTSSASMQNYTHMMPMFQPAIPYGFPTLPPPTFPPPMSSAMNQLQPVYYPNHQGYEWATGLFDCFSDMKTTLFVLFCPCVAFGKIAEIINEGETFWIEPAGLYLFLMVLYEGLLETGQLFGWFLCRTTILAPFVAANGWCIGLTLSLFYNGLYRTKIRKQFQLKGSVYDDYCTHLLCHACALCQQYRQLEYHGFRVSQGWERNKELRRQAMAAMYPYAPPMVQEMSR